MMGERRSESDERVPSTPPEPSPSNPRRGRWAVAAIALLALLLLRGLPDAPPPGTPAPGGRSGIPEASRVSLTLTPGEDPPDGPVSILVTREGEVLAELDAELPHTLVVPRGEEIRVIVEAPGRARFVRWLTPEGDEELRVPLAAGARLAGLVVDDRGEPVSGARVTVSRDGEALPPWEVRTDEEGRFEVDTLHPGEHAVRVSSPGHGSIARSGVSPGGRELRITMERVGSVAGRVVDPEGEPRAGATVVIAGSGLWPARRTETDEEGRFRWPDVPPGVYELRAHAGDLVAEPRRGLEVEPDTRAFVTFTLTHGQTLTGSVIDTDTEEPIDGAQITVAAEALDVAPRAATSDPDGRFAVRGLRPLVHRVSAWAEGYVPVTALEHAPGEPLVIRMVPGGTLVGVVLDEDRQPVEGATIEVIGEDEDHQPVEISGTRGFRGAVFASQLEPIGVGMALPVTEGPIPAIPIAPAPTTERELTPLPEVEAEGALASSHLTDEDGRFRIEGIPPGHVQVVARHPGYAPAATARLYVAAGATRDDLELILAPGGELRGRVVDEREIGVEGVLVEVRSDREPHPRIVFTDDRGDFVVEAVVGELAVTALPNGRPAVRTRATVEPGGEAEVELALEGELHRLRGRTVDARGFPVGNAQITVVGLRAGAPYRSTLFSEVDGTFVAQGLPAGPWRVEAITSGYAPTRVDAFDTDEELPGPPRARGDASPADCSTTSAARACAPASA